MGLTIEEAAECTGIGRNTMRKFINVKIKVPNCVHVRIPNSYQHK